MALLTYDWKPQDPTGAIAAYHGGIKSGSGVGEAILQAYQFREKLKQDQLQFQAQEAMRLAYEKRVLEGERLRQGIALSRETRLKGQFDAENAPLDELPEDELPGGDPVNEPVATAADALLAGDATGNVLNRSANTAGGGSPFRETTDFAGGALPTSDFGGELPPQNTADDLMTGRAEPLQSSPLIEAQNATGGAAPLLDPATLDPAGVDALTGGGPNLLDPRGSRPARQPRAPVPIGGVPLEGDLPERGPAVLMAGNEPPSRTRSDFTRVGAPKTDPATEVLSAAARKRINVANRMGGKKEALKVMNEEMDAVRRSQTPTSKPKVRVNFQDAAGTLYTQRTDGTWENGRMPEPGTKVFTIGAPGRPSADKAQLTWHADGSVTTGNGKVYHYNDDGNLEPASVPKGKTVKMNFSGDDGNVHTQFNDGTWDTPDGEPPEGIKLTKVPGATEEKRVEQTKARDTQNAKEAQLKAIRVDRAHFDREADEAKKEAAKALAKPLDWPWEEKGKFWKKNAKGRKVEIGALEAETMRTAAQSTKDRAAALEAEAAAATAKALAAEQQLQMLEKGRPLPKEVAAEILKEAGGDKAKARALALERGYAL